MSVSTSFSTAFLNVTQRA